MTSDIVLDENKNEPNNEELLQIPLRGILRNHIIDDKFIRDRLVIVCLIVLCVFIITPIIFCVFALWVY
jgi:hypothetical protein